MSKAGPAIFCFAIFCVGALFLFERHGLRIYIGGCVLIGGASLGWAIYFLRRHPLRLAMLVLLVALFVLLLFPPV